MSSATGLRHQARCLLLALICSSTSFQDVAANVQPHISSDLVVQKPSCGKQIRILCEGYTDYEDSGIMYWLANGQFVSELYPRGEVSEGRTEEKAKGVGLRSAKGCHLEAETAIQESAWQSPRADRQQQRLRTFEQELRRDARDRRAAQQHSS
ncbi:Hypothetical predicted protein [Podarcis lilfordi]|uniref:Ig-like domain-containing protein n=1 Tax=Podarcis lilfordi TaxID=74358 RepID=A0AA35KB52_9SAUR|nr:Hypothetical predicted protein [Podarcis lilfordi]